jgi:putative transferase (TIGR04331 family)
LFLITTSYKHSWGNKSENILFAREWCKLFSNKKYWENLNYEVFPYHWLDRDKLYKDIKDLDNIYEKYLDIMADNLNNLHNVNHTKRYWRIIIGPWLNDLVRLIFDYYTTIQDINNSKLVTSTYIVDIKIEDQIPQNFISFHDFYSKPSYNHFLFGEIIKQTKSIPYKVISDIGHESTSDISSTKIKRGLITKTKRGIKYIISYIYSSPLIPNKYKKIVFVSSYFSNKDLNCIQKELSQFPMSFLFDPTPSSKKANLKLRKKITFKDKYNDFEKLLNKLIPMQIPIAYIENYKSYDKLASLFFPKKPKAIFTANAYYYNEAFKFWSAKETENNVKLLVSQHGGEGACLWSTEEKHMLDYSDIFYTWGWSKNSKKARNMPANKLAYTKQMISDSDPEGDILCITNAETVNYMHSQLSSPVDNMSEYVNDIMSIPSFLNNNSKKYLKYRLYPNNYNRPTWGMVHKFIEKDLECYIDKGNINFYDRVSECRLAVIVYGQSAALYETLSANFPTMFFCNPDHWELREEAKPYFDILKRSGIYHSSVQSLCKQINKVYDDVDKWWLSEDTQKDLKTFCNQYAFTEENYIAEWVDELNNLI